MWTVFKVLIEFVTVLLLFSVLVFQPWGMWDFSSWTRDWTPAPCTGRQGLNHWTARTVPHVFILIMQMFNACPLGARLDLEIKWGLSCPAGSAWPWRLLVPETLVQSYLVQPASKEHLCCTSPVQALRGWRGPSWFPRSVCWCFLSRPGTSRCPHHAVRC